MSKRITTYLATAVALFAVLAFAVQVASASSTVTKGHAFNVVMSDPGCHFFSVAGKKTTSLTVAKFVTLRNLDEATLVVSGKRGVQHIAVGRTLTLKTGVYHITMVHQASDDNHLLLVVK